MPSTTLFVHVPVDEITIVAGPSALILGTLVGKIFLRDRRDMPTDTSVSMMVRTPASGKTFRGKIEITRLTNLDDNQFEVWAFDGIFCGQQVRGVYDSALRTGEFSAA